MSGKAFFLSEAPQQISRVFNAAARARLGALLPLHPEVIGRGRLALARECTHAFSTWGMPRLEAPDLDSLKNLQAVFYAAGSVQAFARPLLERGIRVFSAWGANAVPVAEFCLAHTLLACKRYFQTRVAKPADWKAPEVPGAYGETVAILGAGQVGRKFIGLLRAVELKVIAFDPLLDAAQASALGVEKVELKEAFARGYVVSNHLADLPETKGLLDGNLFASMRAGATFVNTGRGATVREAELWRVLGERPDLTAVLDVTEPEPPAASSPAYTLPNALLSPHIAGSLGMEVGRMAEVMIDEFEALLQGRPLRYEVTLPMLKTMA